MMCPSVQAPPAEDASVAAQPDGQQAGAIQPETALQDSTSMRSAEKEPHAAQDDGAAHNGSMRGERKHVRKREEPAGVPLIAPAFMLAMHCPLLAVEEILCFRPLCNLVASSAGPAPNAKEGLHDGADAEDLQAGGQPAKRAQKVALTHLDEEEDGEG